MTYPSWFKILAKCSALKSSNSRYVGPLSKFSVTCDRWNCYKVCLRTNVSPLPSQSHQSELLPSVLAVRILLLLFFAQSSLYSTSLVCLIHLLQCTAGNIVLDSMCPQPSSRQVPNSWLSVSSIGPSSSHHFSKVFI